MMQRTESGLLVPRQRGIIVPGRDFPHPNKKRRASYISSGWNKRNFNLNYGRNPDSGPSDPFFDDVILLLVNELPVGSTSFVDSSQYNWTLTTLGTNTTVSDTLVAFPGTGQLSIKTDWGVAGSNGIRLPDMTALAPWQLGTVDFCLEMYVARHGTGGIGFSNNGTTQLRLGVNNPFNDIDFSSPGIGGGRQPPALTINTFYHLAILRISNVFYLTSNGVTVRGPSASATALNFGGLLGFVGTETGGSTASRLYLGPLRFTRNTSRYGVPPFTPDVGPFPTQ